VLWPPNHKMHNRLAEWLNRRPSLEAVALVAAVEIVLLEETIEVPLDLGDLLVGTGGRGQGPPHRPGPAVQGEFAQEPEARLAGQPRALLGQGQGGVEASRGLADRLGGKPHHPEGGRPSPDVDLDPDQERLDPKDGGGKDAREHGRLLRHDRRESHAVRSERRKGRPGAGEKSLPPGTFLARAPGRRKGSAHAVLSLAQGEGGSESLAHAPIS